jgi:signal transduction histidine kinase
MPELSVGAEHAPRLEFMQVGSRSKRAGATGDLAEPPADYRLRFEQLLSDVSSMLIAAVPADVPDRTEEALRDVVEFFGVDRALLGERSPDGEQAFARVSYGRPGTMPPFPRDTPAIHEGAWLVRELTAGRVVRVCRLSDLPPEAHDVLELGLHMGVRAHLAVPVLMQGRWRYSLAITSFSSEVEWPDDLIPRLRILAEVFAYAYEHARYERERERLLDAERTARSEAELAVRVRDDFLSLAAHELRTPVTALQLAIQALSRSEKVPLQRYLRTIELQVARLNLLVDQILYVALAGGGELPLVRSEVDLSDAARKAVAQMEEPLRASGSRLDIDAPEAVIGSWDLARLEQVVTNLVSNAIKFGAGAPIEVVVRPLGNAAQLVVRDHGIGISPADQARIFGRFERAVSSTHYGGLGLGLYIVKRVVDGLGGGMTCESALNEGSTFTVTLPRSGQR